MIHLLFRLLTLFVLQAFAAEWRNTELTTNLWKMISSQENYQLASFCAQNPNAVHARSEDGRGALWWAFEYGNAEALATLKVWGADLETSDKDEDGNVPADLAQDAASLLAEAKSKEEEAKERKKKIEEYLRKAAEEQAARAAEEEAEEFDYYDDGEEDDEDDEFETEEDEDEADLNFDWDDDEDYDDGDSFHDEL